MAGPGVAIIDSGVNPRHPHVAGGVAAGRSFVPGTSEADYLDMLGHGTAVAGAILEHAPDARLYIARVFHRQLTTSIDVVLAAFDWCLAQPVAFINLSLATHNAAHEAAFVERISLANERGIRIVSPADGWPGCLPGVIGVTMDDTIPRGEVAGRWRACGSPRPIPGVPQERNLHGVSFAVANVTGVLANRGTP